MTKKYGKKITALNAVDLEISQGCIYGIIGPNGAGKSTLLKMIANIENPTSGRIFIEGLDVTRKLYWIKRHVGYCPQQPVFYSYLTVKENLEIIAKLFDCPSGGISKQVSELLEELNLETKRDTLAMTLSGGQKKRLSIMMAIINTPKILLLDEPTAGLDFNSRQTIQLYLQKLRANGMTIILATHNFEDVELLCDNIAFLNAGTLVAAGDPKNIIQNLMGDNIIIEFHTNNSNKLFDDLRKFFPSFEFHQISKDRSNYSGKDIVTALCNPTTAPTIQELLLTLSTDVYQVIVRKPNFLDAYKILLKASDFKN